MQMASGARRFCGHVQAHRSLVPSLTIPVNVVPRAENPELAREPIVRLALDRHLDSEPPSSHASSGARERRRVSGFLPCPGLPPPLTRLPNHPHSAEKRC